jgi:prolyl oligopeptidase
MLVSGDAVYLSVTRNGYNALKRVSLSDGHIETLELPFSGSIDKLRQGARSRGLLFRGQSWFQAPSWYLFDPDKSNPLELALSNGTTTEHSGYETQERDAVSADGTRVPITIIARKNLHLDGSHPTWLIGYGAYGTSLDPYFSPVRLLWLEQGGIVAIAHIRGGGEKGETWHRGGMLLNKQNTIDDMIACARFLITNHYTSATKLAVYGRSAGGIAAGGAVVQHPELFGAAVLQAPFVDPLWLDVTEGGPANAAEYGSTKSQQGFEALLKVSPYSNIRKGTQYPAILATAGLNDVRVPVWMPAKLVASLQTATSSRKPVLLHVNMDGGHAMGRSQADDNEELADLVAFLCWQLGLTRQAPRQNH